MKEKSSRRRRGVVRIGKALELKSLFMEFGNQVYRVLDSKWAISQNSIECVRLVLRGKRGLRWSGTKPG
jgi:hypothetical protein